MGKTDEVVRTTLKLAGGFLRICSMRDVDFCVSVTTGSGTQAFSSGS